MRASRAVLPRHRLLISLATAAFGACVNPEAPASPFGTYHLTACRVDSAEAPVPCLLVNGGPGDSLRVYSGTLTLSSDSTWTNIWHRASCWGGVWEPDAVVTLTGAFSAIPGDPSAFQLRTVPGPPSYGAAIINGRRLELYGTWIYER